jgi:hypothetical protein
VRVRRRPGAASSSRDRSPGRPFPRRERGQLTGQRGRRQARRSSPQGSSSTRQGPRRAGRRTPGAGDVQQLDGRNRYAVYRVTTAKRADIRARRIERFVAMLARGDTPYPQKRTLDG